MSKAPELAICAKLTRKAQVLPSQGGGFIGIDKDGKTISGSYITDDGKRLVNPDGPEAAAIIKELVEALDEASTELCNLLCRSPTSSDPAKHTPGCTRHSAVLARAGAKQ